MKKSCIALAALAASAAYADVSIYGTVDIGYGFTTTSGVTTSNAQQAAYDSASVIGIKASENLGGGLTAAVNFETGSLNLVNGNSAGINFTRSSNASLSGGFGSITLGRQFSLPFANSAYDFGGVSTSSAYVAAGISPTNYYGSPQRSGQATYALTMGDVSAAVAYTLAQDVINGYATPAANANSNGAISVTYNKGPISVNLVGESARTNLAGNRMAMALAGSYDFEVVKVAINLVQSEWATAANAAAGAAAAGGTTSSFGGGWGVGVNVPVGAANFGLQYARNNELRADGSSLFGAEFYAKYSLSKATSLYLDFGTASSDATGANNSLGVGMIITF